MAYYAWCMAGIRAADTPPRMRRGAGRYRQPVALLARLGVDLEHEGRGLGAGLLKDVIARTAEIGTEIGCRGLVVHAETARARDFYLHLVPAFEPSPTEEMHLVLLLKDLRKFIKDRATTLRHHHLWDRGGSTYLAPDLFSGTAARVYKLS